MAESVVGLDRDGVEVVGFGVEGVVGVSALEGERVGECREPGLGSGALVHMQVCRCRLGPGHMKREGLKSSNSVWVGMYIEWLETQDLIFGKTLWEGYRDVVFPVCECRHGCWRTPRWWRSWRYE